MSFSYWQSMNNMVCSNMSLYMFWFCAGQRLYWCNTDTIESASVDGSDRRVLLNTTYAPFFTTLLGEDLYFTDRRYRHTRNTNGSNISLRLHYNYYFTVSYKIKHFLKLNENKKIRQKVSRSKNVSWGLFH